MGCAAARRMHASDGFRGFCLGCMSAHAAIVDGRAENDDESVTSPLSAQLLERRGGGGSEKQKHAERNRRRPRTAESTQNTPGAAYWQKKGAGQHRSASVGTFHTTRVHLPECSVFPRKSPCGASTHTEAQMLTLSADMDDSSSLLDLLECSVCLERLDTTAKVLPCQHTFCRRCLENIVSSRNELRCPECRILVDCGVDDLPANILLVRLLDGIKQRPQRGSAGGGGGGRQSLAGGSLQGYAAGISASPPGTAIRELPVATRSSPVKVGHFPFMHEICWFD